MVVNDLSPLSTAKRPTNGCRRYPSVHAGCFRRISPQFYLQIDGKDVWCSMDDGKSFGIRHFYERMFFECSVKGPDHHIPSTVTLSNEVTDHISDQWYFIRSKADLFSRWYLRTSGIGAVYNDVNCGAIHVSSDYRTRFCIQVRNNPAVPEDFVMIGKDEISIVALRGYIIYVGDAGDLKATKIDMLFGSLRKRFVARAEKQVNGEVQEYVESVERGVGEIWELVE